MIFDLLEKVSTYNQKQKQEIQNYIASTFPHSGSIMISREIGKENRDLDVFTLGEVGELKAFMTSGAGAKLESSDADYNIELLLFAYPQITLEESLLLTAELRSIAATATNGGIALEPGIIITASDTVREFFNIDVFLLADSKLSLELTGLGEVRFLLVVPLQEKDDDFFVETYKPKKSTIEELYERYDYISPTMKPSKAKLHIKE